jgi:hypothetical protein
VPGGHSAVGNLDLKNISNYSVLKRIDTEIYFLSMDNTHIKD